MTDLERVNRMVDWLVFHKYINAQKELGRLLGYTESSMSQILNGRVPLSKQFIKRLSILKENVTDSWFNNEMDILMKVEKKEQKKSTETDDITMSREIFDQIIKMTEVLSSQQATIASQQRLIESMNAQKK